MSKAINKPALAQNQTTFGLFLVPLVYSGQKDVQVAVESVNTSINVIGSVAYVPFTQVFKVEELSEKVSFDEVEAVYRLPLHDRALLQSLEIFVDSRHINTTISDTDISNNLEDQLESGEKAKKEMVVLSLGQLTQKSTVTIKLALIYEIKTHTSERFVYQLPTYLACPALLSTKSKNFSAVVNCQLMTTIVDAKVPQLPDAKVEIGPSRDGNNRTIKEADKKRFVKVSVNVPIASLSEKQLFVQVQCADWNQSHAITEYNAKTKTYCTLLDLCPTFKTANQEMKCEFVICLDMSNSMAGQKATRAKQAVGLLLKSLPEDSYFNIIVFGQNCSAMQPFKCLQYSAQSVELAQAFLENVQPDMGTGKRSHDCLKYAFTELKIQTSHRRQIYVIADGDFDNADDALRFIKSQSSGGRGRLYTLAIGKSLTSSFFEKCAMYGAGECYFASQTEHLEAKMLSMMKKSLLPGARNIRVRWVDNKVFANVSSSDSTSSGSKHLTLSQVNRGEIGTEIYNFAEHVLAQTPAEIHSLYVGNRSNVYAISRPNATVLKDLIMSAASTEGAMDFSAPVVLSVIQLGENDVPVLHTMAAKRLIHDLEEGRSYFHIGLPFHVAIEGKKRPVASVNYESVQKSIKSLAKEYNLMSSCTALVATNDFGEPVGKTEFGVNWIVPSVRRLHGRGATSPVSSTLSPTKNSSAKKSASVFNFNKKLQVQKMPENGDAPQPDTTQQASRLEYSMSKHSQSQQNNNESASYARSAYSLDDNANNDAVNEFKVFANEPYNIMASLIDQQQANGSFKWSDKALAVLAALPSNSKTSVELVTREKIQADIESALSAAVKEDLLQRDVWATVLALAYFDQHLPDQAGMLDLSKKKALKWLDSVDKMGLLKNGVAGSLKMANDVLSV